jgi:hypothetical protein
MEFWPKSVEAAMDIESGSSFTRLADPLRSKWMSSVLSSGSPSLGSSDAAAKLGVDLNFDLKVLLSRPFSLEARLLLLVDGSSRTLLSELLVPCMYDGTDFWPPGGKERRLSFSLIFAGGLKSWWPVGEGAVKRETQ